MYCTRQVWMQVATPRWALGGVGSQCSGSELVPNYRPDWHALAVGNSRVLCLDTGETGHHSCRCWLGWSFRVCSLSLQLVFLPEPDCFWEFVLSGVLQSLVLLHRCQPHLLFVTHHNILAGHDETEETATQNSVRSSMLCNRDISQKCWERRSGRCCCAIRMGVNVLDLELFVPWQACSFHHYLGCIADIS